MNNNTFAKRLYDLRIEKGLKREDIAKVLNCSVSAVGNYEKGNRTPDFDSLIVLAKFFNTSTDYLLGSSDVYTNDKDIQFICEYIGLSENNVILLNSLMSKDYESDLNKHYLNIINYFLNSPKFFDSLYEIKQYKEGIKEATDDIRQNKSGIVNRFDLASLHYVRSRDYFRDLIKGFVSDNLKEYEEVKHKQKDGENNGNNT